MGDPLPETRLLTGPILDSRNSRSGYTPNPAKLRYSKKQVIQVIEPAGEQHPGAGEPHDLANLLTISLLIAVGWAMVALRLGIPRAMRALYERMRQQFYAFRAKF